MAGVHIRAATIEDEAAILPLMIEFNSHEGIEWKAPVMVPALRRVLADPSLGVMLLAVDERTSALAGYGLATLGFDIEFGGTDAFITELFVLPSARGRGVGRALLDALATEIARHGGGAVHLLVRPENARAREVYRAAGFALVPRQIMTKRLNSHDR